MKKSVINEQRARQPPENRTNLSKKRPILASAEQSTEGQEENVHATGSTKPKRRRR
jgi:hypothetical protein